MGLFSRLFSSNPDPREVRAFRSGKVTSAKAAEAYARQQRDRAATRQALAERRAAERRRSR